MTPGILFFPVRIIFSGTADCLEIGFSFSSEFAETNNCLLDKTIFSVAFICPGITTLDFVVDKLLCFSAFSGRGGRRSLFLLFSQKPLLSIVLSGFAIILLSVIIDSLDCLLLLGKDDFSSASTSTEGS